MMADESAPRCVVVKVGGSLFDLPDLGPRLEKWLRALVPAQVILVPGGGPTADVVRLVDQCHSLGEERSHWLALAALALNARILEAIVPGTRIAHDLDSCRNTWSADLVPIMDAYRFARADDRDAAALPHSWSVTGDSVAARVAKKCGAGQLILLKSANLPAHLSWAEAGLQGFVDAQFAAAAAGLSVSALNFRAWRG